jgi:hypothetical protein
MRRIPTRCRRRAAAAALVVCGLAAAVAAASDGPVPLAMSEEERLEHAAAVIPVVRSGLARHPKIATPLLEVIAARRALDDWRAVAAARGMHVDGDAVLVEIRGDGRYGRLVAGQVESHGGRIRHQVVPSLVEAWLAPDVLERVAEHPDVLRVAPVRPVRMGAGSVLSEGVAVLNVETAAVDHDYHDLGADGSGVVVANIDGGYANFASLQASGDWPQPPALRRFEVSGGGVTDCDLATCTGFEASNHGAATMEIVFDLAPGADYLTYATTTIGDWYTALVDAASRGADVVTESLSAPLDGVGDGTACPPIWGSPCGTIAEAAALARSQGVLVVNSAANYGTEHWGGTFVDTGGGTLDWGSGGNLNLGDYCYPNGYLLSIDLFWDDWTAPVDHDYDLQLYELRRSGSWRLRASSTFPQDGGAGRTPQEAIRYVVSGAMGAAGCPAGTGVFGILVERVDAASDRHLQVFANDWISIAHLAEDRSLGFPADSPNVYTVGAVDVASPATVESYSSEGPVLGPGGSASPPVPANPKPDGVSVAQVSTVAYGPGGFAGTSASAPHAAGVAAVLTQLRQEKYSSPPTAGNPEGRHRLLSTFALEDPTFPATHATDRGHGLVALRFCDLSATVSNGEWVMLGLPCNRRDASSVAEVLGDDLDLTNVYWEVWDWDAASASYRQLGESDFLTPGVGYWLLYEADASIDIQGLVADRSEAYPVAVVGETSALGRPNFLGHPFAFDVPWPDVTVFSGGIERTLQQAFDDGIFRNYAWKPYTATGYDQHDGLIGEGTLSSFDGFWVKAWQDAELRIPTSLAVESAGRGGTDRLSILPAGWSIRLEAVSGGTTTTARIGQFADSVDGWDAHDAELMPSFEPHQFYLVLPHPEWGEYAGDYVRDIHGFARTDAWRFEVRSNIGGDVTLRWDGPLPVLRQSFVIDLATGAAIPAAKLEKGHSFAMAPGSRAFLWRVR